MPGTLAHLVATYGYPALAVLIVIASAGVPLPISPLLLAFGALSARPGGPNFLALALLATAANLPGDLLDFGLGRLGGPLVQRRLAHLRRAAGGEVRLGGAGGHLRRDDSLLLLLTRFLFTPISSPVSVLAGASGMRLASFLTLDLTGKAIYAFGYLTLGRVFGAHVALGSPLVALVPLVIVLPLLASVVLRRAGFFRARDKITDKSADKTAPRRHPPRTPRSSIGSSIRARRARAHRA